MSYPYTPKSALKLQFGDYWPIRRDDGAFGFFVFIARWGHLRSAFTAAILDHVQSSSHLEPHGSIIPLRQAGHLHVKTFPETGSEVCGNISLRLDPAEVQKLLQEQQQKSTVWGYRLPIAKVNQLQPNEAKPI